MMKLTPIAVISGASRGAPRSGRYATNSIVALSDAAREHREQDQRREDDRDRRGALAVMEAEEVRPEGDREHAAEHEHVAVREVDQLEDAVDERVAQRDERVDGAVGEPDQRRLREVRRRDRRLLDERATSSPTTKSRPSPPMNVGRLKRVARVGAEASAATVQATLLRSPGKSYLGRRVTMWAAAPEWRNWQTRRTQNPLSFGACGFESHLRHRMPRGLRSA